MERGLKSGRSGLFEMNFFFKSYWPLDKIVRLPKRTIFSYSQQDLKSKKMVQVSLCNFVLSLQVTLPTFILEKRSLLEMYSDFLGHAELFIAIPGGGTPRERMIRVLKYYLTSFHCGRKGIVRLTAFFFGIVVKVK